MPARMEIPSKASLKALLNKTLFAILILAFILTACSPAMSPSSADYGGSDSVLDRSSPPALSPEQPLENSGSPGLAAEPERLVIKNASLTLVVNDPAQSMQAVTDLAAELDGYVVSANLYQTRLQSGQEVPRASITIRVPAGRLNEALDRLRSLASRPVVNETISSEDVTRQYTDLQSRLRNLEAAEVQLLKIMDSATKTEDVLNVHSQLTQVREQIEVTKGQIQYYEQSAALSAISLELLPNEAVQPLTIGTWQPVGEARDAVQALIDALQILARAGIWLVLFLLPVLLVIFLPLYVLARLFRNWRSHQKSKARAPAPPAG